MSDKKNLGHNSKKDFLKNQVNGLIHLKLKRKEEINVWSYMKYGLEIKLKKKE